MSKSPQAAMSKNQAFEKAVALEFMDLSLNGAHPFAWGVNQYPVPTGEHFDVHAGLELGIVLSGRSHRFFADFNFVAEPGDIWLAAPWEPHGMRVLENDTSHLVLGLLPEFLGVPDVYAGCDWLRMFHFSPAQRHSRRNAAARQAALAFGEQITSNAAAGGPYQLARTRLLVQAFLIQLMEQMPAEPVAPPSYSVVANRSDLLPALRLIEADPGRRMTLADAAQAAHMCRSRFAEQFRLHTGLTFAEYLLRRRIGGVMSDLKEKDQKLSVIAERWGFSDASHLARVFKQRAGCTPETFRRSHRQTDAADNAPSAGKMPRPTLFVS